MNDERARSAKQALERFNGVLDALGPNQMVAEPSDPGTFATDPEQLKLAGNLIEAFDRSARQHASARVEQAQSAPKKA